MFWVLIRIASPSRFKWVPTTYVSEAILMSTHNVCFYRVLTKIIPLILSPNTHLIVAMGSFRIEADTEWNVHVCYLGIHAAIFFKMVKSVTVIRCKETQYWKRVRRCALCSVILLFFFFIHMIQNFGFVISFFICMWLYRICRQLLSQVSVWDSKEICQ